MSDSVQAFLAGIGPRPLTYEEACALQILRIKAGKGSPIMGVIERLAEEARSAQQQQPDDTATHST